MFTNYRKLLALLLPVFTIVFLQSACKKMDKYPAQTLPVINGIFPNSAFAGTAVTIKGSNLKNVEMVRFDTASLTTFNASSTTDTSLTVIVPDSLPVGDIFVQVYYKDGTGYSAYKFKVLPTPKIPIIDSTDLNTAIPGTMITLWGKNFDVVTDVKFGTATATFTATATKIITTVPAGAAGGIQSLVLTAPEGADTIPFTISLAPVITALAPSSGKVGDVITVTGERLTNITSVKLGSLDVQYTPGSASQFTFVVPDSAVTAKVSVTTSEGVGLSPAVFTVESANIVWVYKAFDGFTANYAWSGPWSGVSDFANTEVVKTGETISTKHTYQGQWSGYKTGIADANIASGGFFVISVYGATGTNGKKTKVVLNGDYNNGYEINIQEGVWQDFKIPMTTFGSPAVLKEIVLQEFSGDPFSEWSFYITDMGVVE